MQVHNECCSSTNVSEPDEGFKFNREQRKTMSSLLFAFFFDGLDTMLYSLTLVLIMKDLVFGKEVAGLIASVFLFGQVAGGITIGIIGDWLGRKRSLVTAVTMYSIGTIACACAPSAAWLAFFRALTGFGGVGAQEPIACYISETVPPKYRSRYTSCVQLVFGLAGVIGALMVGKIMPHWGWRAVFFIAGGIGLFIALPYVVINLKETESFLNHKKKEHKKSLFDNILDIFREPKLRKNWLLGLCLPFAQQTMLWSFLTLVPAYVIAEKGYSIASGMSWFLTTALAGSFGFFVFGFIADYLGRKTTFRIFALCAAVFLPLAMMWAPTMNWFRVLSALAVLSIYGLYTGVMTYLPELFPTRVRSSAVGITNNSGRLLAALSPAIISAIAVKHGTPIAVSITSLSVILVFIALMFGPETKGRTMEELTGDE